MKVVKVIGLTIEMECEDRSILSRSFPLNQKVTEETLSVEFLYLLRAESEEAEISDVPHIVIH